MQKDNCLALCLNKHTFSKVCHGAFSCKTLQRNIPLLFVFCVQSFDINVAWKSQLLKTKTYLITFLTCISFNGDTVNRKYNIMYCMTVFNCLISLM